MTARFNPFRPGNIVNAGMFSGRGAELLALERVLFQTKNGNPHHFIVTGERGIGKTSLFFYLNLVANGEINSLEDTRFNFLVISIELQPTTTYAEIIKKIGSELQRTLSSHQKAAELLKTVWDFVKRWEAFGVSYTAPVKGETPHQLLEDLTQTVAQVVEKTALHFDGILFLIDEADKPPAESHLGEFVKLFSERLIKRGCERFSIGLSGLPTLVKKLRDSHESAPRIFQILSLEPLLPEERIDVVRRGLTQATEKGSNVTIIASAEKMIADLSEGFPHFIQQFAYCAFEADQDDVIDDRDVQVGAFNEDSGAIQQLGLKYYEDPFFGQISSEEYREVLRAMSMHSDDWISKTTIRKETGLRELTLTNALRALKNKNIILCKKGRKGVYRLPTKSFAVWIRAFTQRPSGTGSVAGS
jgi:hypothetical protein